MKFILTLILFLNMLAVFAQQDLLGNYLRHKKQAEHFREFIETATEPSTFSGARYFDYHSGIKKAYLFNGDFQLPVTLGGKKYVFGKSRKFYQCIQFVPQVKIRIFQNDSLWDDKSKPVRTPSYIPKLSYYISNEHFWNDSLSRKFYAGISILHHSNGQDGWEYVGDSVNIKNGSFSESLFWQISVGGEIDRKIVKKSRLYNKISRKADKLDRQRIVESSDSKKGVVFWKFSYEDHPDYFTNQKFNSTGVYGGNRISTNLGFRSSNIYKEYICKEDKWCELNQVSLKENFRVSLNMEYITDLSYFGGKLGSLKRIGLFEPKKRFNACLSLYKRILDSRFPAVFVQAAYYGSDNYNIYFQKSMFQLRIGIAFSFFEYRTL